MTEWIRSHSGPDVQKMLRTPFYVVSDTENTLKWKSIGGVKINWSLNEDLTDYHELPADTTTEVPMQAGKKVYLFCMEDQLKIYDMGEGITCKISCAQEFRIGGNICFLNRASCYNGTEFQPALGTYELFNLFYGVNKLVDASQCIIGASYLRDRSCGSMFSNCTSLTGAPLLPTTQFPTIQFGYDENPYSGMFDDCPKVTDLHFPKSLENDATFLAMKGAPKFGATNATVYYDL